MNQAASAIGRPPAGSTATASCCPVFNPFFFAPQTSLIPPPSAQQCYLGSQATQVQPITSIQSPPVTNPQQQQPNLDNSAAVNNQSERSQQQTQRPQDHSNHSANAINNNDINNYTPSFTAQTLSLQHLLANRPATNCMALAAAIAASASFPHIQQLQHPSQLNYRHIHQQSSTSNTSSTDSNDHQAAANNSSNNNTSSSGAAHNITNDSVQASNPTTTTASVTNQVPILNFNNTNSTAPQNLNINCNNNTSTHDAQTRAHPPVAAHLTQPNVASLRHQQSNLLPFAGLQPSGDGQNRPLATNTLLSNIENQQQQQTSTAQRRAPIAPATRQQQQNAPLAPNQHMTTAQPARSGAPSDEALSNLLNDQLQASMLLNQIIANNQFAASLGPISLPPQPQQQQLSSNRIASTRSQFNLPNQAPIAPAQQVPLSFVPQQRLEQASNQAQQSFQQQLAHQAPNTRIAQVPAQSNPAPSSVGGVHQQHHTNVNQQQQQPQNQSDRAAQPMAPPTSIGQSAPAQQQEQQQPPPPPPPPPPQQPTQPQGIPPMPFYPVPQVEQVLSSLIANPALFSQFLTNMYFQSGGLRSEQHTLPNPPHPHFHHHLHGSHHHHHHGPNGQGNAQDATLPVDSLAISESKPKGLNRAEIDSLTHYIHTDEKDSRTCVICLSKFELKSKIRPLSCNHAFHAKCVDKWLRANRTCPICRRDALKSFEGKIKRV